MNGHKSLVTAALAVVLTLTSCGGNDEATEELLRPVRYETVYATGGTRVRTFSGVAQASLRSNLSFRVAGTIEEIAVKVGDTVRSGQLIARLDDSDFELQVQEAEASLEQAQAQERNASATYDRTRQLYENRNASKNDLDAARAAAESAEAQVQAARKRLQLARSQLSYTTLSAPINGSIAAVPADLNENVQPGTPVAVLTSGQRPEVEVAIPEMLISQVREGDDVTVTFDAIKDREFDGQVIEVGVAAVGTVTTFPVTIALDVSGESIRPGMAASVSFTFESADDRERFVVPPFAIGQDRNGRYAFVVNPSGDTTGTIERRTVTVGELTEDGLEVFDGLFEGDLLVTAGVSKIVDGQAVKLTSPVEQGS